MNDEMTKSHDSDFNWEKLFILFFVIFIFAVLYFLAKSNYYSAIWAAIACCNSATLELWAKHKKQIYSLKQQLESLKQQMSE